MEIKKYKFLILGSSVLSIVNIAWIYLYSLTGISFEDSFDFNVIFRFLKPELIILLFITGLFIALAAFFLVFFTDYLEKKERIIMAFLGSFLPMLVCIPFYKNISVFLFITAFYLIGCMLTVLGGKKEITGIAPKLSTGYHSSKKIISFMAIGGLLSGIIFTYINLPAYKEKTEDSMVSLMGKMGLENIMGGIDLSGMISKDFVRSIITKDYVKNMLVQQYGEHFNNLSKEQQDALIDQAYNTAVDQAYEATRQQAAQKIPANISSEEMKPVIKNIIETMPLTKTMFSFLPIMTGLINSALILFFGQVCVTPFSIVLGLALPKKKEITPPKKK